MKKIKNRQFTLLFFLVLFVAFSALAQNPTINGINKIYHYLQMNADTTFVLSYGVSADEISKLYFISKKGDTVTSYFYGEPNNNKTLMPKEIRRMFHKRTVMEALVEKKYIVDINSPLFNAYPMNPSHVKQFWNDITKEEPFKIKDDILDGEGCPDKKNHIYDGGEIKFDLITKDAIKHLYFYSPEFYEKKCPLAKKGRSAILEIERLYKFYFRNDN
ncbi:MAG: hypothetical protein V4546_01470 [Bacteroidota bacterium]